MTKIQKMIMCLTVMTIFLSPLVACNTVEGVGEDTAAAGHALDRAANENKTY